MDKQIYKYLKDEETIGKIADDIVTAFHTKMNKDTIDYSFDIAQGTGKIKNVEQNTFFNFDATEGSILYDFKKALFHEDLKELTTEQENMLIEDVSYYLKQVSTNIMERYESDIRNCLRHNIMPNSKVEDIPMEKIIITSIDVADWSGFGEAQKYLLRIGKKPGAFINTDVIINYIQDRQEETGKTVKEIFDIEKDENNPLFEEIISIEQGSKYLYDINVNLFVDYSLAVMPPKEIFEKI
jgi:hypothetical protein